MIWTIAQKELLENFYSLKFRIVTILCISVMITSNFILLKDYQKRMENYTLNLPKAGEARVVIKPSVLSLYATGLQKIMERGYDLKAGTLIIVPSATILNVDFFSSRFAVPDVGYLVKVLLSLLAMLLAFDAFCGEKLKGTLRLLLSNGIPRAYVALGKILGNLIAIGIPFTFAFLFGLLLIMRYGKLVITAEEFTRIGFFYAGSVLYLAIFVLFAVTVSARTKLPNTSLVVCLFLWAIVVFGIPNMSGTIARVISPIPSAQALEEEKMLTYDIEGHFLLAKGETDLNRISERLRQMESEYRNLLDRYIETTRKVSRLSPASSYVYFASSITQNGFEDDRNLKWQVLQYRDVIFQNPEKVREIQFTYNRRSLSESLQDVMVDMMLLSLFVGFFFVTSYTSFLRYDVR